MNRLTIQLKAILILAAAFAAALCISLIGIFLPVRAAGEEGLTHEYLFETSPVLNTANDTEDAQNFGVTLASEGERSFARFNGEGYISLPADALPANELTFILDIRPETANDWQKIVNIGTDQSSYFQICLRTGADNKLNVEAQLTLGGPNGDCSTAWGYKALDSIPVGEWSNIAVTVENDYMRVYVNGTAVNERKLSFSMEDLRAKGLNELYLGKSLYNDPLFQGDIDDLRIYERALSPAEIAEANGTAAAKADLNEGVTHYYSFNDPESLGLDNTGSGANAVSSVNSSPESADDSFKTAALFDGGFMQLPSDILSSETNAFSVSLWIKPTEALDYMKVVDLGKDTEVFTQIMLRTSPTAGKLHAQIGLTVDGDQGSTATHIWGGTGTDSITVNEWAHLVYTIDGNYARLWVNGKVLQCGAYTKTVAEFAEIENAQQANYLGKSHFADPNFRGYMDEVVFYDRALNLADVTSLYEKSLPEKTIETEGGEEEPADVLSDLAVYYSFDGSVPGIDYSGNQANAIITKDLRIGSEQGVNGELGNYLILDGKKDFLVLPENILPKEKSEFTYASWVYFGKTDEYIRIFDFGESSAYFDLRLRANGVLESTFTNNQTAGETKVSTGTGVISANNWAHVAITVSGSRVSIYVDGILVTAGNFSRELNTIYNENTTRLTQNYVGLSRYAQDAKFMGYMDEIRVYTRALTASDVQYLAEGNKAAPENVTVSDDVQINGEKPHVDYIVSAAEGVLAEGDALVISKTMTAAQLCASLTLIDGASAQVADNYDFAKKETDPVQDGDTVKIFKDGEIVLRLRVYMSLEGSASCLVRFDADGGDGVQSMRVPAGSKIDLPYTVKDGYEFVGWFLGEEPFTEDSVVNASVLLKARWEVRTYRITFELSDGTRQTLSGKCGETVTLTNFGDENIRGFRIDGVSVPLGEYVMPDHSVVAHAVYAASCDYTVYNGEFENLPDGSVAANESYSLALFDGQNVSDGEIEMTVTPNTANDCGIVFRCETEGMNSFWETAPASYYCALINWEGWLIIGKVNADGQTWQCPADYKLSDYDPSKTYVLRVSFTGANIKVYVNDALYIDYTDPSPLSGTGIGFRSTGDRTVLKLNYIHQNKI